VEKEKRKRKKMLQHGVSRGKKRKKALKRTNTL
jgi:hypothetical protein